MSTESKMTTHIWRLLGECRHTKNREEIRSQTLEGWTVWSMPWNAQGDADILVPDPNDFSKRHYAQIRYAHRDGGVFNFAVVHLETGWRFYVPASLGEEGAFEAGEVRYEGFWRASSDEDSDLGWPEPDDTWKDRTEFLRSLDRAEASAQRISYRGYSTCRVCHHGNGSESLRLDGWEWPSGFRHYIAEHGVRPTSAFEEFILTSRISQISGRGKSADNTAA